MMNAKALQITQGSQGCPAEPNRIELALVSAGADLLDSKLAAAAGDGVRPRGCRFAAGGDKLLAKLGVSSLLSAEVGTPCKNEARFFPLIRRLMGAVHWRRQQQRLRLRSLHWKQEGHPPGVWQTFPLLL